MIDLRGKLPTRAGAAPYYTRPLAGIVGTTLHYTASPPSGTVESIARYQVTVQTGDLFPAIAYTLITTADGKLYLCHDLETRCWHSGAVVNGVARNRSHVGICYIGNYSPSLDQVKAMAAAHVWCERQLGRRLSLEGHNDVYATSCPGPVWPAWRGEVLKWIDEYRRG